ncbi:hypothetical protein [Azonexus hydrophilus]|uniref:Uncharacterized protein n=1 Tax=Azonexus hydrophilus TaxID=418702 RepID=A0ABZ2XEU7_9RHOO
MKVRDLLAKLLTGEIPGNATVYVQVTDPETGLPVLAAVTGIARAESETYGSAAIIELED